MGLKDNLNLTKEDMRFYRYLVPVYGLYSLVKDCAKGKISKDYFCNMLVGEIPYNILLTILSYKPLEYIIQNPAKFLTVDIPNAIRWLGEGATAASKCF